MIRFTVCAIRRTSKLTNLHLTLRTSKINSIVASKRGFFTSALNLSAVLRQITMPKMHDGDSASGAIVTSWKKSVGDYVTAGETICEVETDKITTTVTSEVTGYITSILIKEGSDVVKPGQALALVSDSGETNASTEFSMEPRKRSFVQKLKSAPPAENETIRTDKEAPLYGWLTIRDGQKYAIWDKKGNCTVVSGPQRIFLWEKTAISLKCLIADSKRYVQIMYMNGNVENIKGPVSIWFDPIKHKTVTLHQMVSLISGQLLVVYKKGENGKVVRSFVEGPTNYMPDPAEYIQQFSWGDKKPFSKIQLTPQRFEISRKVRTKDNAELVLNIMLFYKIVNVEKLLESTHDPIANFSDGIAADVIEYTSKFTLDQWRARTADMNNISTYPQTLKIAEKNGLEIERIVFQGFTADSNLMSIMRKAIEKAAELKMEEEAEQQKQQLKNFVQQKEKERQSHQQEFEKSETTHKLEVSALNFKQKAVQESEEAKIAQAQLSEKFLQELNLQQQKHALEVQQQREKHEIQLAYQKQQEQQRIELELQKARELQKQQLEFLRILHSDLNVDLTKYLIAKHKNSERDININMDDKAVGTHLHLEVPAGDKNL